MKLIRNESGYSLLVSLMLILLFAILGAGLLAMTFNGVARNETREHITQSQDLATKGLQKLESQIQAELKSGIPATGYTNTQFETHFNTVTNRYLCSANKNTFLTDQQRDGEAKMCISSVQPSPNYPESMTMKELKLQSIGSKGGHDATVYKTVDMGAEDIEKVLNYTLSTLGENNDGGNLYLHGSSDITGDLNIPGNIFSTKKGYAYINGDQWANSLFSRSLSTPISTTESKKSTLNLGGESYTFNPDSIVYENHIVNPFSNNSYQKISTPFDPDPAYQPEMRQTAEKIEPINFDEEFDISKAGATVESGNKTFDNKKETIPNSQHYKKDLTIKGNTTLTFAKNIFIDKDLIIGSSGTVSPSNYANITIDGKRIYVKGNVTITNVNLQANFTLYTQKDVTIREVTISGIKKHDVERGSIIVFSNGDFHLSNISEYQDTPSTITGFFYSSGTMELYGFASNTTIIGGVAGENVVLNAMRGRSKNKEQDWPKANGETTKQVCDIFILKTPSSEWYRKGLITWCKDVIEIIKTPIPYETITTSKGWFRTEKLYYDVVENQKDLPSRLQIIYNEELLNVYRNTIDYTSSVIYPSSVLDPVEIELEYGNAP